jgi:hypothetical protein
LGQDAVVIASAPWAPPLELLDEELLDEELVDDELLELLPLLPLEEDEPLLELLDDDDVDEALLVEDEPLLDELLLPELDPEAVAVLLPVPPQALKLKHEIEANSSSGVGRIQWISERTERGCSAYSLNGSARKNVAIE